ncbi:hypothetical protein MMC09_004880 [Bachmanniomyces sp. S44760]|nr:hypothetical protein [Bachmanniomyces sp. S44760]
MASNPPAQCCTIGVKHEGTPTGEMIEIGESKSIHPNSLNPTRQSHTQQSLTFSNLSLPPTASTYVARPSKPSTTALLFCTDVIGHVFTNAQLIADQFAANGYLTVMPDLFHGDPLPLNRPADFDLQKWLKGPPGHGVDRIEPVLDQVIKYMKTEMGVRKIGAVGYCFGAKYAIRYLSTAHSDSKSENNKEKEESTHGSITAAYVAHPSFVENDELEKIQGPLSISAAETDSIFTTEKRHESEEILKKTGLPWQINLFSGVQHGFAVRGDLNRLEARFAKEQAFYQAVLWFDAHLKE